MAQERPATPEKQLLKLIEQSQSKKNPAEKSGSVRRKKATLFSIGAWKSRFSFSQGALKKWLGGAEAYQLDIKTVNRILVFLVLGLGVYFATSLSVSIRELQEMPDLAKSVRETTRLVSAPPVPALKKEISYYLERPIQRDIFKMGAKRVIAEKTEEAPKIDRGIEIIDNLKLVGVSWSSNPDAMVEDKKAFKTFFVRKGQKIGDIEVKEILKDKLILVYEGKEYELK